MNFEDQGLVRARIAADHGGMYLLAGLPGVKHGVPRGALSFGASQSPTGYGDELDRPTVGDWVWVRPQQGADFAPIEAVEPRSTLLVRKAPGKRPRPQAVAANVDSVFVLCSLNRDFNLRRVERYVAAVAAGGAQPVVLLTKSDLCADLEASLAIMAPLGAPVLAVSAFNGAGLEALEPYLQPGASVALVGSSGVGKSTLANRLLGEEIMAVKAARADDDRGRHTTSHRQLLPLPGGAVLIDTPGMRELGLWDAEEGLATAFPEVEALGEQCAFRDCAHQGEPGCAIAEALASGELDPARLAAMQKLERELAHERRKRNPRLQRETARKWKKLTKGARERARAKGDIR